MEHLLNENLALFILAGFSGFEIVKRVVVRVREVLAKHHQMCSQCGGDR